jgi:hypothetical protein
MVYYLLGRVRTVMSKIRKSKTGKTINELDKPITLKLHTKCPDKYILIDTETGQ